MPIARNRSSSQNLVAIPRLGFLLFLLALAIVVWPNLRRTQPYPASIPVESESTSPRPNLDISSAASMDPAQASSEPNASSAHEQIANVGNSDEITDGQTRDLLSLVVDNSLRMTKREMPAYWELVRRSAHASFSRLREAANLKIRFNDLYSKPSKHRGELIGLDITIRRVIRYEAEDENSAGAKGVYEIWGSTEQSQTWLYAFITDSLPEGFDEDTLVRKKAEFAGYFFKLMAYQPGSAPPNAKPLLAPLLIGKFRIHSPTVQESKIEESHWPSIGFAALIVAMATYFSALVLWKRSSRKSRSIPPIQLDDLEQPFSNDLSDGR